MIQYLYYTADTDTLNTNLSYQYGLIDWLKILFNFGSTLSKTLFSVSGPSHSYTIYTHSYYYIYNIYTYYLQIKLLKLLKSDIFVINIDSLLKDTETYWC